MLPVAELTQRAISQLGGIFVKYWHNMHLDGAVKEGKAIAATCRGSSSTGEHWMWRTWMDCCTMDGRQYMWRLSTAALKQ